MQGGRCDGSRRRQAGEDLVIGFFCVVFGRRLRAPFFFWLSALDLGFDGEAFAQRRRLARRKSARHPAEAGMVLGLFVWRFAKTDSRPCVVCRPSMAASYFLLLAQKKVTKENGTLGFAPLASGEGSLRADGFRPQAIHGLLSKSARSLAPPACGARGWSVRPPPLLRGNPKSKAKERKNRRVGYIRCRIYPVLLRQGLPRSALPGFPLGRGKDSEEKPRSGGRQDAGHFDESTWMCSRRSPPSPCVVTRAWMPARPRPRGCCFFGYFLLGKQKKVTGRHGWSTKHTRT